MNPGFSGQLSDKSMRIILINPSYFSPDEAKKHWDKHLDAIRGGNMYYYPFEPPLGLASITSYLMNEGHYVKLVDIQGDHLTNEDLKTIIVEESPDLIGITALTTTIHMVLEIAKLCKSILPGIPIVLGGVHPTVSPESLLTYEFIDYIVRGEGEEVLSKFIKQGLKNPENIKGLCWKNNNGTPVITKIAPLIEDLDTLPFPDYSSFPIEKYIDYTKNLRGIKGITMMVTRGCPYKCSFCAVRATMGPKWRRQSPEKAARWMMQICSDYDLDGIWFKDSTFNINKDWTKTFAETLLLKNNPYMFQINTRIDLIRTEEISLLKKAGLVQVDLGIESGSPISLKTLRKKITVDQIRSSVKLLKKMGLKISGFFMIGIPGENEEDINMTVSLARELELDFASVSIFTPLPGSELYDDLYSQGKISDTPASFEHHHFTETNKSYCEVPIERLREIHNEINGFFSNSS